MAYHVVPTNDFVGHEASAKCICLPLLECADVDGKHKHFYVHSALDNREPCDPIEAVRTKINENQNGF